MGDAKRRGSLAKRQAMADLQDRLCDVLAHQAAEMSPPGAQLVRYGEAELAPMGAVDFELDDFPSIQWNHVDGPLLVCRDGTLHWLTMWERLALKAGCTTIDALDAKHNSEPRRAG